MAIADRLKQDYDRDSTKYQVVFTTDAPANVVTVGVARENVRVQTTVGRLR
jgi:hypothetical protein